nr:uncharacterized protein LOC104647167 [Solanum lycopersicum]
MDHARFMVHEQHKRRVVEGREAEKARSLGHHIRLVQEQVGVHLESKMGPNIRRAMIEIPNVTEGRVVSVVVRIESGHMIRDFPNVKSQAQEDTKPRPNTTTAAEPPKRNRFYPLKRRQEKEKSNDMVSGNLLVFTFTVYVLLDLGSTLSCVNPLVASKFDFLPEMLHESFLVTTPIGDNIRS